MFVPSIALLSSNSAAIVAVIVASLYLWWRRSFGYWQRRGVPTLPTHWLYGNFQESAFLKVQPAEHLGRLYAQAPYEDFVGLYIFNKPVLMLRNLELIKTILVKDFQSFPNRVFASTAKKDTVGTNSLFSITNPQWKYIRGKLSPTFSSGKLKKLFYLILETSENMKNHLGEKLKDSSQVKVMNVKEMAAKYSTDIVSSLAFGVRTNSFDENADEFYQYSLAPGRMTFLRGLQLACTFFMPRVANLLGSKMLAESTDYFRSVFWASIDTREKTNAKRNDIIDSLIVLKNEKQSSEFRFEGDTLLAQSAIFFIAGRESTTTTISFTLYELAKQPKIQDRARQEIRDLIKSGELTYENVSEMKYLYQVISETLRLYPPAPIIDRKAVTDYQIPGTDVVIEKGTAVYIPLMGLHKDPQYFEDPLRYDPDRFTEERKAEIKPFTYMPFGEGPRYCIGMRMGLLQTAVGLITILRDYEVSLNPDYKDNGIEPRSVFLFPRSIHLDFKRITAAD